MMPRKIGGPAGGLDRKGSKSRIVPLADAGDGQGRKDSSSSSKNKGTKKQRWASASKADPEAGAVVPAAEEDAADAAAEGGLAGCVDCIAAYSFTCSSIENFCRCIFPHNRHVPRVIYLVVAAFVLLGLLVILFVGVSCQVEATALVLDSDVLAPAPAPGISTTTRAAAPLPYYRLTLEGGNYYSFAEIESPDCALTVVKASSQLATTGDWSAEASVDGDPLTCFQTPEGNMDAYGPTYIVYACAVRTRNFTVDTSNRCGFGPVTSHTVQWSWGSDGANGTWYDLAELPLHRTTTAPATTPNHTTPPVPTTELVDQRANVRVFAGADCTGAALWGVESMDLCYYEFPDGNFTQAAGAAGSIQILKDGVTASTYGTCLYKWDEDGPVYLQTFTGVGCHNVPAQSSVGAVEVAVKGTQLCSSGLPEGVALTVVGLILLGLYLLAGMCPLVYHAVFVAQCCIAKTKRKQIVFRD